MIDLLLQASAVLVIAGVWLWACAACGRLARRIGLEYPPHDDARR